MRFFIFLCLAFSFSASASSCVSADANGYLIAEQTPISNCSTFIILSKDEYDNRSSFFDLFSLTQSDYEQLLSSFLLLIALSVTLKLVLRFLYPK
jgi:hypothetical protein